MKKKKLNTQLEKSLKVKKSSSLKKRGGDTQLDPELKKIIETGVMQVPEVTPSAKKTAAKDKIHYVNGKEFEEEIRQYYKSGHITTKLGESLTKIANGLSYAPNFINYSYKDDMIGDAIVKMFSALRNKKFKLDTGFSPFSYFTTIAFHAFINRIKKENKHHSALDEYRAKVYTEHMINPELMGGAHIYVEPDKVDDDNYNTAS